MAPGGLVEKMLKTSGPAARSQLESGEAGEKSDE
jgi:hypothetical protein